MKKVLVSLLIMSLLMTTALTAFAVPTIDYAFKDTDKIYVFGKLGTGQTAGDAIATDYAIEITDKDNEEIDVVVGDIDETKIANIKDANRFGVALTDEAGRLDNEFIVRAATVAPMTVGTVTEDIKVYSDYYEVDVANETVTKLTNMTSANPAFADYEPGRAKINGAINFSTGAGTYNNQGLTLSPSISPIFRLDISSVPANAKKVTLSIGTSRDYTNPERFLEDDFAADVYKIPYGTLDKWSTSWTYAAGYTWADLATDADSYKNVIADENKVATILAKDVEKVTYNENSDANVTSTNAGIRFVVDITDAVNAAKTAGESTIDLAVKSTGNNKTMYLRSIQYEKISPNNWNKRMARLVAPRIDVIK